MSILMKTKMKKKKQKEIDKEELTRRTWQYFWQQKTTEIMIGFIVILGLTLVPYILGFFGCAINPNIGNFVGNPEFVNACTSNYVWWKFYVMGIMWMFFAALIAVMVYVVINKILDRY